MTPEQRTAIADNHRESSIWGPDLGDTEDVVEWVESVVAPIIKEPHVLLNAEILSTVARLRAALQRYGRHDEDCTFHDDDLMRLCSCGLSAALGESHKEPT